MAQATITVPAANGSSDGLFEYPGGWATLACFGTFDSGTVIVEASYDAGVTWIAVNDTLGDPVSFAANGLQEIALGGLPLLRVTLSGSSGSTSCTFSLNYGMAATMEYYNKYVSPIDYGE